VCSNSTPWNNIDAFTIWTQYKNPTTKIGHITRVNTIQPIQQHNTLTSYALKYKFLFSFAVNILTGLGLHQYNAIQRNHMQDITQYNNTTIQQYNSSTIQQHNNTAIQQFYNTIQPHTRYNTLQQYNNTTIQPHTTQVHTSTT